MPFSPLNISSGYGHAAEQTGNPNVPIFYAPNNAWYFLLQDGNSYQTIQVFKSTDNQKTWVGLGLPLTIGTGAIPQWCATFDGQHSIAICFTVSSADTNLRFLTFDFSTETFSAVTVKPIVRGCFVYQIFVRSDGSYAIVVQLLAPVDFDVYFYVPSTATLSGPLSVLTNFAGVTPTQSPLGALDATDLLHLIFVGTVGGVSHLYYQQVTSLNVLGNSHDFGAGSAPAGANCLGPPIVVGSILILPLTDTVTNWYLITGTPLAAPAFSALTAIDTTKEFTTVPTLYLIGGTLYAVGVLSTTHNQILSYSTTNLANPLLGWTASTTVFDGSKVTGLWSQNSLSNPINFPGSVNLYFESADPTGAFFFEYLILPTVIATGKKQLTPPLPRTLPWPTGQAHHSDGKNFMK